jgi:hypothetical protein
MAATQDSPEAWDRKLVVLVAILQYTDLDLAVRQVLLSTKTEIL